MMKKLLLFATAAAMTAGTMNALEPTIYPGYAFCGISPDGNLGVSYIYGAVSVVDFVSGQAYDYSDEEAIYTGNGNFISNNGKVVGAKNEVAAVWEKGEWFIIESASARSMSSAKGITPDGSRIVGIVAPESYKGDLEGLMMIPCYWDLQSDGTYGEIKPLPYPTKDFSGRTPQYVTAISVSNDGKTIVGQIQDYSGAVTQPIVYTMDKNGEWEYKLLQEDLYHPEGVVLPPYPGDEPNTQPETFMTEEEIAAYNAALDLYYEELDMLKEPQFSDFMSDENKAAYQAALDAFYETWDWENYPSAEDYMTEEEMAAYNKAYENYFTALNEIVYPEYADYMSDESIAAWEAAKNDSDIWWGKYTEYAEAFYQLVEMVPNYTFNNVLLSPDGKQFASTTARGDFFTGYQYNPSLINLEDGTSTSLGNGDLNLIVTTITEDGTLLAQKPASFEDQIAKAYILPAGAKTFEPLDSYIASINTSLGDWIKENMTHKFTQYNYNFETGEETATETEMVITGIPFANADLSVYALTVENTWYDWDNATEEYYPAYGYVFSSDWAGIAAPKVGSVSVKALADGVLAFTGEVASVQVYDIAGRSVYSVSAPGATAETELGTGIYIVKAVATDGSVTISKIAF